MIDFDCDHPFLTHLLLWPSRISAHKEYSMAVLQKMSEKEAVAQILGSAALLQAYIECSDALQVHAKKMVRILVNPDTDEEDAFLAATTLFEILFPYTHEEGDGMYGMDLEAAENLVRNHGLTPGHPAVKECDEAAAILDEMDAQEATFADRLEALMKQRDMTQTVLAQRIGVGQSAIAMMLKRECRPQNRTVARLAEAFGVKPEDLWPESVSD